MSRPEHERAINLALATGDALLTLFDALGSKTNPTRGLWAAFGLAKRALEGKLDDERGVKRVLAQLRETAHATMEKNIARAMRVGEKQATRELEIYGLDGGRQTADNETIVENALVALDAELDALLAKTYALVMFGNVDEDEILGDDSRVGILRASDLASATAYWMATGALLGWANVIASSVGNEAETWHKQAIAAMDERTTDCCLRVHGQTVPLKGKFRLTGTPRYADELGAPPFHFYCRTATALVRVRDTKDDLTRRMEDAARAELGARAATGSRTMIHPADAFSGRAGEF